MTEKIKFDAAGQAIERQARGAGFRRGIDQVVNLVEAFQARGINFGAMDGVVPEQNEK